MLDEDDAAPTTQSWPETASEPQAEEAPAHGAAEVGSDFNPGTPGDQGEWVDEADEAPETDTDDQ